MKAQEFVAIISDMLGWGDVTTIEDDNSSTRKIVRSANLVLRSVQAEQNWKDLRVDGTIVTQAPIEDELTISANTGEDSIVLALATAGYDPDDYVGCLLMVRGQKATYRIVAIVGDNVVRLDRPWMGEALAGAYNVTIGRDRYQLPDDYDRMNCVRLSCSTTGNDATLAGDKDIEHAREGGLVFSEPTKATTDGRTSAGKTVLTFDFVPNKAYVYEYKYQRNHPELKNDVDALLYPPRYHLSLVDQVVARLNRDVENQQQAMVATQQAMAEKVKQGANPDTGNQSQSLSPWTGRGRWRY